MTETSNNGTTPMALPEFLVLTTSDSQRVPSPGTQRALKAETGHSWEELMGEGGDSADRFQTIIWTRLRKDHPGLRWEDCAEVEIQLVEDEVGPDPLAGALTANSQPSAGSGG